MSEKIVTLTSKGQITLPVHWRRGIKTPQVLLRVRRDHIEISPITLQHKRGPEYTVFDALRDNKGKGLKAKDLVRLLDKW